MLGLMLVAIHVVFECAGQGEVEQPMALDGGEALSRGGAGGIPSPREACGGWSGSG